MRNGVVAEIIIFDLACGLVRGGSARMWPALAQSHRASAGLSGPISDGRLARAGNGDVEILWGMAQYWVNRGEEAGSPGWP